MTPDLRDSCAISSLSGCNPFRVRIAFGYPQFV